MLTPIVLLCVILHTCVSATSVTVSTEPNGDGKLNAVISISATEDINGWEVMLTFSSAVTKLNVSLYMKSVLFIDLFVLSSVGR